jgi:hypothetical protein
VDLAVCEKRGEKRKLLLRRVKKRREEKRREEKRREEKRREEKRREERDDFVIQVLSKTACETRVPF